MLHLLTLLFLLFAHSSGDESNLYARLGVKKTATLAEIKKAYRKKARDTHPDKQKQSGVDEEQATINFRQVVEAYETLSDASAKRTYDQTGRTVNDQGSKGGGGQGANNWNFNFNNNFRSQQYSNSGRGAHRYMFDPYRRRQILDAQSRTLNVHSLDHLQSLITNDEDIDSVITEKMTLLAFYDSSNKAASNMLINEMLYPYPFAGYNPNANPNPNPNPNHNPNPNPKVFRRWPRECNMVG